ncbi:MAG: site-specific DNA-methyltransferase [Anaerolineaceae bacterium]
MTKKTSSTDISSFKHQDKRVNIPPQELSAFMEDEERAPKTTLYPRDPSLDPQLVWKGKDAQDQEDLTVPSVPIYIQEKIQPQAIIENVRKQAAKISSGIAEPEAAYQMDMFGDFNHIEFKDLVEFYEHEQNWSNRMVLGDSLLVMNSLAEKEGLKGRVQMIYMDPPYGIKFGSNWQTRLRKRDVKDGAEADLTREPEQVKAFRDTWELGIHSYLSYLRDRFSVARELLTESGSIFVQISEENIHLVRCILDEVFGSENFVSQITFAKTTGFQAKTLSRSSDYLLWYASNLERIKYKNILLDDDKPEEWGYKYYRSSDGFVVDKTKHHGETRLFKPDNILSQGNSSEDLTVHFQGDTYTPNRGNVWKTTINGMQKLINASRIYKSKNTIQYIRFSDDYPQKRLTHVWTDTITGQFSEDKIYVVQTSTKVIERCMLMTTDPGDLVLDPTCGSGTTAYVAEQWGRRWITVDTSRVSIALARMRLMTARYPYYLLSDSAEGYAKETELTLVPSETAISARQTRFNNDLRMGFVYQRVPHITLRSIANNEEIDTIHAKWQEVLEPLRAQINQLLGTSYEEWEMPKVVTARDEAVSKAEDGIASQARNDNPRSVIAREQGDRGNLAFSELTQWWDARRQRQAEIDASIAKRADVELLYDKPSEDGKRIRVCGPFTVESLSPHRVLATAAERPESEKLAEKLESGGKFEQFIINNLRTSGVQNTRKSERLNFTRLEPFVGAYLQASGEYLENNTTKRVAVCIGPEHSTVTPDLVKEAAKEAMQGVGFDLLVVLGFAFDPYVSEEIKQYGRLKVFPGRINPDLMMGDLLKKTKSANLFTAYGEPDIDLRRVDGKLVVKLKGVDIFDPTTGEIRSSKPEEIACWFVDDDYNGESFFVRQAYFTGWDEPYEKLKRALRAEVDESAWQMLYRSESIPFTRPEGGKIAVKVINDYGDEVMKVFAV